MRITIPKFLLIFILGVLLSNITLAQSPNYPNGFAIKGLSLNHIDPFSKTFSEFKNNTLGGELTYLRHLKGPLNLAIPFKLAEADFINELDGLEEAKRLISLDALLHLTYFRDHKILAPYLLAGIGVSNLDQSDSDADDFDPQIPVGVGLHIKLHKGIYAQLQYEYRFSRTNHLNNDQIGAGLSFFFGGKPKIKDMDGDGVADEMDDCPEEAGTADLYGCPDTDGDGIANQFDKCPELIGLAKMGGCPDTDSDGVADNKDDCPNDAGPRENGGCPVADEDGDGIPDDVDDCPTEAGLGINNGCPVAADNDSDGFPDEVDECPDLAGPLNGCPDSDGDGVADKNDNCPTEAGLAANNGCPSPALTEMTVADKALLAKAMYLVEFQMAQANLKTASSDILDQIVDLLRRNPSYNLEVSGHTDSIGSADTNLMLSERRAKACYDYLILRGIDASRLTYVGFGETQPIATNKYKAGRDKNRRVEFSAYVR